MGDAKDKIVSLFKTSKNKDHSKLTRVKNVDGGGKKPRALKIQKQSECKIIKMLLKKENESIKDRIIRDIKNLTALKGNYFKPLRVGHCHYIAKCRGTAHGICNLEYIISKEIPVVFHDRSNYDYHFMIQEPAKELEPYLT